MDAWKIGHSCTKDAKNNVVEVTQYPGFPLSINFPTRATLNYVDIRDVASFVPSTFFFNSMAFAAFQYEANTVDKQ